MHDILVSALKVILWPLLYSIDRKIKHRNDVRNGIRAPHDCKPAELDIKSRRPITPPLAEPPSFSLRRRRKQSYNDQASCSLLSKLPIELRLMIWELCLDDAVHLYWHQGHMLGHTCLEKNISQEKLCAGHNKCYSKQKLGRKAKPGPGRLALVLTCRRIYTEAIDIMYSKPVFDFFLTYYCVQHLPSLILPHRMHRITKVDYFWDCRRHMPRLGPKKRDHFTQMWVETWETLAQMQGLKCLRMEIVVDELGEHHWVAEEKRIVKSMEGVLTRQLEKFELKGLPFESIQCARHESLPFPYS